MGKETGKFRMPLFPMNRLAIFGSSRQWWGGFLCVLGAILVLGTLLVPRLGDAARSGPTGYAATDSESLMLLVHSQTLPVDIRIDGYVHSRLHEGRHYTTIPISAGEHKLQVA